MRRAGVVQGAAALIGVAAGVVSAGLALSANWYTFGDTAVSSALLGLAAGAALLGAGLTRLRVRTEPAAGALLATAGIAWFMTAWDDPYAPAWILVAGRMFGTAWPVLVTHAVLRMFGPATRSERGLLVAAYACTVGASLAATLFFNPATNGCATCPANPLLLIDAPDAAAGLEHFTSLAGPVWATLLVAALTHRLVEVHTPSAPQHASHSNMRDRGPDPGRRVLRTGDRGRPRRRPPAPCVGQSRFC